MSGRLGAIALVCAGASMTMGGCTGDTGEARVFGTLQIPVCGEKGAPYANQDPTAPREDYDLDPGFIGGEPFNDIRTPPRLNRLVVRLQRSGKRVETNDVLTLDFVNSYEVARCLGAHVRPDGTKDFNEDFCVPLAGNGSLLKITSQGPLRAYFTPRGTCSWNPNIVATAISEWDPEVVVLKPGATTRVDVPLVSPEVPADWESWIHLVEFGSAKAWRGLPCDRECELARRTFKVDFDQRIQATAFHLLMLDDRVVTEIEDADDEPLSRPEITARLVGEVDFDLRRGQGAQTFP